MSGRGLGHTGGTLDKLESIPGFRVELSIDAFVEQVRDVGLAIVGQTADLVPADKLLYALRDVTGDGRHRAADRVEHHVEEDRRRRRRDRARRQGRRRRVHEDARGRAVLAEAMLELGRRAEREVVCLLTDMDQPLGAAVGNALEIREARDTVRGEGPPDFTELVLDACARLLALSDLGDRRRTRAGGAPRQPSPTARRSSSTSAGSRRRAAIPTRRRCRARRSCARSTAPRAGTVVAARRDRDRPRGAASRRRPQDEGGRDRPRRRRRLPRQARRRGRGGRRPRRGARARRGRAPTRPSREVLAAYELGDEAPPERGVLLEVSAGRCRVSTRGRHRGPCPIGG